MINQTIDALLIVIFVISLIFALQHAMTGDNINTIKFLLLSIWIRFIYNRNLYARNKA